MGVLPGLLSVFALVGVGNVNTQATITLRNDYLTVEALSDRPVVTRYVHSATGEVLAASGNAGRLRVNGEDVPWDGLQVGMSRRNDSATYSLVLPALGVSCRVSLRLEGAELVYRVDEVRDPEKRLFSIAWRDLPLVAWYARGLQFWRLVSGPPDPSSGGKMWMGDRGGSADTSAIEDRPEPVIHGCAWLPGKLLVTVDSNYPLFPAMHRVAPRGRYEIALGAYQYRVRDKVMPPLEARVSFLGDENRDGDVDLSDYCLWMNARLPDPDPVYLDSIWYKIFVDNPDTGLRTDFGQAGAIVEAIHNVTDGLPQIAYLVGWQQGGHDVGYPALNGVNERAGGQAGLRVLAAACRDRWNTILSGHTNIDDADPRSPAFDPSIMADNGGNLSHCRDVESGKILQRINAMLRDVPFERTIHFDNTRITSAVAGEGIGVLEELECGLRPIIAYMRAKGFSVTTEGQNGIPIDCAGLFDGFWHYDTPLPTAQLFHRKIVGGGWGNHWGPQRSFDYGLGSSLHQDITYLPVTAEALGEDVWQEHFRWVGAGTPLTLSFIEDWDEIVDRFYRGTLLYHFYLEGRFTALRPMPGGVRQEYDYGQVVAENTDDHLVVKWGDVTVAENDDRFIPRAGAVYAYSLHGADREWVLPETLRGRKLEAFSLSATGRGPAPVFRVGGDRIRIALSPRVPVKVTARETEPGKPAA